MPNDFLYGDWDADDWDTDKPETGLAHYYVGTNSIGSSGLAMASDKMYTKETVIPPMGLLAAIEAHIRTTDNETVGINPCLYANNAGQPGRLIGYQSYTSAFEFNGVDRWLSMPVGYFSEAGETVFSGVHAPTPGNLQLSHETSGGNDLQVDAGGSWTIDPAGTGGSVVDPGSHLYSIRALIIEGWTEYQQIGRSTVGGSQLNMGSGAVWVKKISMPANSLLLNIAGHMAHPVANVNALSAHVFADSSNAPGIQLHSGNYRSISVLLSTHSRWFYLPVGRYFLDAEDVWIGIRRVGSDGTTISYDASGGADGQVSSPNDSPGAYTAGDDDISMFAGVLL